MLKFDCPNCGNSLFFNNQWCLGCGTAVNFSAEELNFIPAQGSHDCANRLEHGVCNWQAGPGDTLCRSCALNEIIPDLSIDGNKEKWGRLEEAKRRLLFSCLRLGIALEGVTFRFLASTLEARVLTGHADGVITINLDEADPAAREATRQRMDEKYRTLVGHFRHEFGHYFWDRRILPEAQALSRFRELFGDERIDYQASLREHYSAKGEPEGGGSLEHVSDYAQVHPWEDWAESFAHYLHLRDVLETAQEFGLAPRSVEGDFNFAHGLLEWQRLSVAFNEINRSMGHHDLYPFTISSAIAEKLEFVHQMVDSAQNLSS